MPFTPCAANRFSLPSPPSQADVTVARNAVPTATAARGRNSTSSPGTAAFAHTAFQLLFFFSPCSQDHAARNCRRAGRSTFLVVQEQSLRRRQAHHGGGARAPLSGCKGHPAPPNCVSLIASTCLPCAPPLIHRLTRCLQAEREKLAAAAAPKERSPPAPRRDQAAPRKEGEGRREGGAFQSRRDGGG